MVKLTINRFLIISSLFFFIINCTKTDPITGEKIIIEPNASKKQQDYMEKQGGIFSDYNKKNQSNTFDFATSNVLWRATLKSLDFLPLVNADYSGGVIIYDWYSDGKNNKEQIKVSVKFLNNELRSDSLEVTVHKKTCDNENNCTTQKISNNFNQEIKDTIIASARSLKLAEQKNSK
jgi:hypothetical protein